MSLPTVINLTLNNYVDWVDVAELPDIVVYNIKGILCNDDMDEAKAKTLSTIAVGLCFYHNTNMVLIDEDSSIYEYMKKYLVENKLQPVVYKDGIFQAAP